MSTTATQALLSLCEDQGRRKAELSTAVRYGEGVNERLRAVFVDDVFEQGDEEEPGQLGNSEVFDRIRKGLPVFRERP